jgi:hypothetical protein
LRLIHGLDECRRIDPGRDRVLEALQALFGLSRRAFAALTSIDAAAAGCEPGKSATVRSRFSGWNRRPIHRFSASTITSSRRLTVIG